MVMELYLQNPRSGCLIHPPLSGGRRPLEMNTVSQVPWVM